MVVMLHASQLWSDNVPSHPSTWLNGAAGVDLFFVISGFVMALTRDSSPWSFIKRRVIRVVPLYWIMTTLMLVKTAAAYMHPDWARGTKHIALTVPYIAASYLFIPFHNSVGQVLPILGVGWTLSYEMLFYACFAIALSLRINPIRLLTPTFAALSIVGLFFTSPAIVTLASPLLLEFVAGLWLGNMAKAEKQYSKWISVAAGVVGIVALLSIPYPPPNLRPFAWGTAAFLIVFSAIGLERNLTLPKWTQKLGDASYAIYLAHFPIFTVCHRILNKGAFNSTHGEAITVTTCLLLSIGGAVCVHKFVEIPITAVVKEWAAQEVRLQLVTSTR